MRPRTGPLSPQEGAAGFAANLGGTTWEIPAPQGRGVFCVLDGEGDRDDNALSVPALKLRCSIDHLFKEEEHVSRT